ncbi:hypothetical protein GGX14DRAFT_434785 [Mycena pura]|uniref:U4/U6.U5 small nuclear ribonucleoprotein 27kDa protein domain-containing protein n=1 Tax=Mycena pura TaxID=153505 RepID=A0AAD6YFS2_9AGAR|nr:hypothetical protein GGX14DRAFT_434785 [Mycena pura]
MSSRRRDKSWERDDRDSRDRDRDRDRRRGGGSHRDEPRRRSSRSRSPRRNDRDRRNSGTCFPLSLFNILTRADRRDYRYDDRRESDRRRKDDGRDRDHDQARSRPRKDGERDSPKSRSPAASRDPEHPGKDAARIEPDPQKRLNLDPDAPEGHIEEGEEMDDDAGMMAMMGLNGFGSTKVGTLSQLRVEPHCCWQGKHIDGNQEGTAFIKKERTWRQYMNR